MLKPGDLGKTISSLTGRGTLCVSGHRLEAPFELVQYADGGILLFVAPVEVNDWPTLPFDIVGGYVEFRGTSSEGLAVVTPSEESWVRDVLPWTDGVEGPVQILVQCQKLEASKPDATLGGYLEFNLVNYQPPGIRLGAGVEWLQQFQPDRWVKGLPLRTRVGDFFLVFDREQEEAYQCLRLSRATDVSCSLLMALDNNTAWEQAEMTVGQICRLLALLTGTRVNWTRCLKRDENHDITGLRLHDAIVSGFLPGPIDVTPNVAVTELAYLGRVALESWAEAERLWNISDLIDAFVDARSTGLFVETKALRMCLCLEMMVCSFFDHRERGGFSLPEDQFKRGRKQLYRGVKRLLSEVFPEAEEGEINMMTSHASSLNRLSFQEALQGIASELGLSVELFPVNRLKTIRNGLVHTGRCDASEGTPSEQLQLLERSVRRALLAMSGYKEPSILERQG